MKVLNNVLWVLVWVFMASACYEDKGNYDYRDLDEIIIDTAGAGIRTDYSVALQETLAIPLKVYCNGKLVNGSEKRLSGIGIQMGSHTARNDDSYSFQRYAFN